MKHEKSLPIHRDLSWIEFIDTWAKDPTVLFLERVKGSAIFSSNRRDNEKLVLQRQTPGKEGVQMYIALQPLVALIAGILILIIPRLLNYIVAIYLIVVGILGLAKM